MIRTNAMMIAVAASLGLSACVSPEVVTANSVTDKDLSCKQIAQQLAELEMIRTEAEKGRSFSGENVAAGILFWPAVIGNVSNANRSLEAANKRQTVLVALSERKRCA